MSITRISNPEDYYQNHDILGRRRGESMILAWFTGLVTISETLEEQLLSPFTSPNLFSCHPGFCGKSAMEARTTTWEDFRRSDILSGETVSNRKNIDKNVELEVNIGSFTKAW